MSFKHTCFVSYSHGQNEIIKEFVMQLKAALDQLMEVYFKKSQFGKSDTEDLYFIDMQRLTSGSIVDTTISEAIFDSVCMLVAYWPSYEASDYCLRELEGMKQIEVMRKKYCNYPNDTECLIIPVYFKCCGGRPSLFGTEGLDVSRFFLATGKLSLLDEFFVEITKVCEKIKLHYDNLMKSNTKLKALFKERKSFLLPDVPPSHTPRKKPASLICRSGK